MPNQNNLFFRVGDVVGLKLDPEFKAVIKYFLLPKGNYLEPTSNVSVRKDDSKIWANLSRLNPDFKVHDLSVPVIHLRFIEDES
jgi:hypothetical protein